MKIRHRQCHVIALGTTIGALIGAMFAQVITLLGAVHTIWWTPAGFVTAIFGGMITGFMLAEVIKGGTEDKLATAEANAALHTAPER